MPANSPSGLRARLRSRVLEVLGPGPLAEEVLARAADCQALVPASRSATPVATFGGDPVAPPSFRWPMVRRGHRVWFPNFLGQIDLSALRAPGLPGRGILYLFVAYLGSATQAVELRAIHWTGDRRRLRPVAAPDGERLCDDQTLVDLRPCSVMAVSSISLPLGVRPTSWRIAAAGVESQLGELGREFEPRGAIGRIGGWANGRERDDLYRHVHLTDIGRPGLIHADLWESWDHYRSARRRQSNSRFLKGVEESVRYLIENEKRIERGARSWRLVLELGSNREMGLQINDSDPLFIFGRGRELEAGRFDRLTGRVLQG